MKKARCRFVNDFSFYSDERQLKGSQFCEFPEKEKLFPAVSQIVIENPAGEVTVDKSADDQVHLVSFLRVYYSDKGSLDELRRRVEVKSDLDGGDLKISARYPETFPYQNLRILFRLLVPPGIALSISNQEGDMVIRDTGKDLQIDQENGNLVLENIPARTRIAAQELRGEDQGTGRSRRDHGDPFERHPCRRRFPAPERTPWRSLHPRRERMTPSWNTPMAGCGSMESASWRSPRSTAM